MQFLGISSDQILDLCASDLLDIMGCSSYPAPPGLLKPHRHPNFQQATLPWLRMTLDEPVCKTQMNQVAQRYGRFGGGPYAGQFMKQGLAVEYDSALNSKMRLPISSIIRSCTSKLCKHIPGSWKRCGGSPPTASTTMKEGGQRFNINGLLRIRLMQLQMLS